jgi:hypothetical protein
VPAWQSCTSGSSRRHTSLTVRELLSTLGSCSSRRHTSLSARWAVDCQVSLSMGLRQQSQGSRPCDVLRPIGLTAGLSCIRGYAFVTQCMNAVLASL